MILPNNGKVIIIDDQLEDVKELIAALSKEKVPFVHYKEEDLSDLPDSPVENVRLIFLDLELITDTYIDSKNITSPIKTRLIKLIKPRTAYALVIWSKKENEYKNELLKDFERDFFNYKPLFYTSLPKADIIGKKDAIEIIRKELGIEMKKFQSFNAFLVWEAIVNESAGNLINNLAGLYDSDVNWNEKTKHLLYKLALAYSGKAINGFNDIKQLKNALYTLTNTLTDNIENSIELLIDDKFSGLISKNAQKIENFTSVINKVLLFSESSDDISQPGNVYNRLEELREIMEQNEQLFQVRKVNAVDPEIIKSIEKKYRNERQQIEEKISIKIKESNDIVVNALKEEAYSSSSLKQEILQSIISVELNVTPLCDYAQEKVKMFRILPGVFMQSIYRQYLNGRTISDYISDPDIRIDGIDYFLLLDYRYLFSLERKSLCQKIKFRIKQQLLSDIQAQLSAHVNRSGVLYLS